jgi:trimeric autotransporter adhesin
MHMNIKLFQTRTLTLGLAAACCVAALGAHAQAHAESQLTTRPDALLAIDLNRAAVVEKISALWSKEIPANQTHAFKGKLGALRADQLLSASLTGSFDGVLEILNTSPADTRSAPAVGSAQTFYAAQTEIKNVSILSGQNTQFSSEISEKSKALGEAAIDLVYTPVTPCRLFDTRAGLASAMGTVGGTFNNQQTKTINPNGACGIPTSGVASIFLSFHAYNNIPSTLGVIGFMKPGTPFSALAATWTGSAWATGTFIAGTNPNGSFDAFVGNGQTMTADMIVDVMGYFQAPNRTGDGLRVIAASDTLAGAHPNVINGDKTNAIQKDPLAGNFCIPVAGANVIVGATIGGGYSNTVSDYAGTIAGGLLNKIGDNNCDASTVDYATIGGGRENTASATGATVAGGYSNLASGGNTFAVGFNNTASGNAATAGGGSGNVASGTASVIPGGRGNTASGDDSFAAGRRAKATRAGQFVWADNNNLDFDPTAQGSFGGVDNTFHVRATGGVRFATGINATGAITTGCFVGPTLTGWSCTSDRSLKNQIKAISPRSVLEKLAAMPVTTWTIIGSNSRQMGPMAQDFYKSFGLGNTDTSINSIDAQGVAFAAIQGLNQKLVADAKAKDATIASMQRELSAIKKKLGL